MTEPRFCEDIGHMREVIALGLSVGTPYGFWDALAKEDRFVLAVADFIQKYDVNAPRSNVSVTFVASEWTSDFMRGLNLVCDVVGRTGRHGIRREVWTKLLHRNLFQHVLAQAYLCPPYSTGFLVNPDAPITIDMRTASMVKPQMFETPLQGTYRPQGALFPADLEVRQRDKPSNGTFLLGNMTREMGTLGYRLANAYDLAGFVDHTQTLPWLWPAFTGRVIAGGSTAHEDDQEFFLVADRAEDRVVLKGQLAFAHDWEHIPLRPNDLVLGIKVQ